MPSNIKNQDEAMRLVELVESGQLSPEDTAAVMDALGEYEQEALARDDFMTRVDMEPKAAPLHPNFRERREYDGLLGSWGEGGYQELMGGDYATEEEARNAYLQQNPFGKDEAAASLGVDVEGGAFPQSIRATASLLSFDPEAQAEALGALIERQFEPGEVPAGIPLVENVNGVLAGLVKDPETGTYKYAAINPAGFDSGDFASLAGELPGIALETGGAIAGAVGGAAAGSGVASLPLAVAGSAAGSAAGAALSVPARIKLAQLAGVPDEVLDKIATGEEALEEAVWAAAGDLIGAGVFGAIRKVSNVTGGRILEAADVERVFDDVAQRTKVAQEFAEETGQDVKLTLAQATGDSDIIVAEQLVRQQTKGKGQQRLAAVELKQDRAVQEALRGMTNREIARQDLSAVRDVTEVAQDVTTGIRKGAQSAREAVESAADDLDAFGREMDDIPSPDVFIRTREAAYEARDAALEAERKAWSTYRKEAEWAPGQGSNIQMHSPGDSPIKRVMLEMDDDAGRALLESTRSATTRFLEDAGLPVREGGATKGLAGEWLDPRELHFTLSDLKRRVRSAERGMDPDGFRVTDMKKLINAIEETIDSAPMRRVSTGGPVRAEKAARVRESFRVATDMTRRTHSLFDGTNMKTLLETNPRTGSPNMPAGMIRDKVFQPKDARFLDEALEAVGENPAIKASLGKELVKKHAAAVRNDATGQAHARFVADHADHIRRLGIDPDTLRGPAGLAQAVKNAEGQLKKIQDRLSRTFGRRLSDETTDVVNIHDEMMKIPANKVGATVEFLEREAPELLREVRAHSLSQIRRELSSKGDTMINFEQLWKYVDENGGQLAKLHGEDYVKDLTLFKRMEQVLQQRRLTGTIPGQNVQPAWLDITRSQLGPLSKKQRFLTAAQRTTRRLKGRALKAVIASPEDLGHFVRNRIDSLPAYIQQVLLLDAADYAEDLVNAPDVEGAAAAADAQRSAGSALYGDIPTGAREGNAGSTLVPGRPGPAEAVQGLQARPSLETLKRHEGNRMDGDRHVAYTDSVGKTTIGYGHNLDDNPLSAEDRRYIGVAWNYDVRANGLTEAQAERLLQLDHRKARTAAANLPGFGKLNEARKEVLTNMVFNMGVSRVRGFKNMLAAIAKGDYDLAAREMLDSKWAEQVGRRADELAEIMRQGS